MKTNKKKSDSMPIILTLIVLVLLMGRMIPIAALIIAFALYNSLPEGKGGCLAMIISLILGLVLSVAGMVVIAALIGM